MRLGNWDFKSFKYPWVLKEIAIFAGLAAIYFLTGKLSLRLAFYYVSATPIWPPTGIALAAFLFLGYRIWPAIFLGAFLVNVTTSGSIPACLGVAAGNTLEGLLGAYLVTRYAAGRFAFEQPRNIVFFALLAGVGSTMISATIGTASLFFGGSLPLENYAQTWLTWWLGDMAGAFTITPLIILWVENPRIEWNARKFLEAAFLSISLSLVAMIVFCGFFPSPVKNYPLEFLCVPFVLWGAFRFGRRGAATITLLLFAIALSGTLQGFGPFVRHSFNESLLLLQGFIGFVAVTSLVVAALVALREIAEEARLHLSNIVKSSEEAIIGTTLEAIVISWNKGAERIYGYTASEMVGHSLNAIVPKDRYHEVLWNMNRMAHGEALVQFETKRVRKDGVEIDVAATISPIIDDKKNVIGASTIVRDITERKKLEAQRIAQAQALEQSNIQLARREKIMRSLLEDLQASKNKLEEQKRSLQEANQRLESLSKLKDEFVSTASHELRTPLTAIREGISLIHDRVLGPINDEQYEFLSAVDENIDRLTELINNILDLAKIEAGRLVLSRKKVALEDLIRSSVESCKTLAGKRELRVEIDKVPEVFVDSNRVLQVLWNLFSNAIKFTDEVKGQIIFKLEKGEDGFVTVSVRDNGVGIAKEDLPKLFKKFSQVGEKMFHGTGLGLALCKEIVQLHHGDIWAVTDTDRGSEFKLTLPVYSTDFVLQESFAEHLDMAKRIGRQTIGVIAFNASKFIPGRPEDSAASRSKRLEQMADFFRKNVYPSDTVLTIDSEWILVLGIIETQGIVPMIQRLSLALEDWTETLADKPAAFSNDFGFSMYPQDGGDIRNLFETAKNSIHKSGKGHV